MTIKTPPKVIVQRAVRQMSPALREQYDNARRLLAGATSSEVKARYRVARIVADIKTRVDRYGTRAVPLLALALGKDETTLYRYATVAEVWSEEDDADILLMRMPSGLSLSWSHLLEISVVETAEARTRLLNQAISRGLSVRALAAIAHGDKRAAASGGTPASRVERIVRGCVSIERRITCDAALFGALEQMTAAEAAALVARAVSAQEKVLEILESNVARLRQVEARMRGPIVPRQLRAVAHASDAQSAAPPIAQAAATRPALKPAVKPAVRSDGFPRLLAGMRA